MRKTTSSMEERRASSAAPRGTSKGTRASESVRLARTMRWAMVGSGRRKARAISAVVKPPSRRSVSATRASVERTGWQAVKMRRSRSSPMSSSRVSSKSGAARSKASSSRPSSSCLRSSIFLLRNTSRARCLAAAISHAPGFSGTPDSGQRSSAVTSASCANSSASPTSRTSRARPAMSLADSILQTVSMARCVSVDVTDTHHTIKKGPAQAGRDLCRERGHPCPPKRARARLAVKPYSSTLRLKAPRHSRSRAHSGQGCPRSRRALRLLLLLLDLRAEALLLLAEFGRDRRAEVRSLEDRANLYLRDFAVAGVALVGGGDALDPLDGLLQRAHLPEPEARDHLLRLGEGAVDDGLTTALEPDPLAFGAGAQPLAREHHAGLDQLLVELAHIRQHLPAGHDARLRSRVRLDNHHHSHLVSLLKSYSVLHP